MILMTHRKRTLCYMCKSGMCPGNFIAKIIYKYRKPQTFSVNPTGKNWEYLRKLYEHSFSGIEIVDKTLCSK